MRGHKAVRSCPSGAASRTSYFCVARKCSLDPCNVLQPARARKLVCPPPVRTTASLIIEPNTKGRSDDGTFNHSDSSFCSEVEPRFQIRPLMNSPPDHPTHRTSFDASRFGPPTPPECSSLLPSLVRSGHSGEGGVQPRVYYTTASTTFTETVCLALGSYVLKVPRTGSRSMSHVRLHLMCVGPPLCC